MISVFYGCARRHRPFNPCIAVITNAFLQKLADSYMEMDSLW